jgi:RimJ/RimL family protein N-acetyltransferase
MARLESPGKGNDDVDGRFLDSVIYSMLASDW